MYDACEEYEDKKKQKTVYKKKVHNIDSYVFDETGQEKKNTVMLKNSRS